MLVLHTDEVDDLGPALGTRLSLCKANIFPGVELRNRLKSHIEEDKKATNGTLHRASSTNAYHRVPIHYVSFVICALLRESQLYKLN